MNALAIADTEASRISATMDSIRSLIERCAPRYMRGSGIKRRKWTPFTMEERAAIRRQRRQGASYKELCALFHRSETQIAAALRS